MAWNKNNPAAGITAKTLDDLIRTNNAALEAALDYDQDFTTGGTQTGKHHRLTMPEVSNETGLADHVTIWNSAGAVKYRDGVGTIRTLSYSGGVDAIPAATRMWFHANTAPTGWTIYATIKDALLAVKSASGTYATGGASSAAGTWTQTGHTHTGGSHTLATSEIPSHTHSWSGPTSRVASDGDDDPICWNRTTATTTGATGGGGSHSHGATASGAEANTYRPSAVVGIIATKDAY